MSQKDMLGRKVSLKKAEPKFMDKFLRYSWVFSAWYEKIILAIVFGWGLYNLVKMINW